MKSSWLSKIGLLTLGAPLLLIGVLWFAPEFIPAEKYRSQIEEKLEAFSGRDVKIAGDVRMAFLPRFKLEVNDISIGQPDSLKTQITTDMIHLQALHINIRILPLLSGQVVVDRFDLIAPMIELAHDAKGNPNWIFTKEEPKKRLFEATPAEAETDGDFQLNGLAISGITVENGRVSYQENPATAPIILSNINTTLKLPSLNDTASIDFSGMVEGTGDLALQGKLSTPQSFLDGKNTELSLTGTLGKNALELNVSGTVLKIANDSFTLNGTTSLTIDSVQKLMAALGSKPSGGKDASVTFNSKLSLAEDTLTLGELTAAIGDTQLAGTFAVGFPAGGKPKLEANLALKDVLDLTPFMTAETKPEEAKPDADKVMVEPGPATVGWSTEPMLPDLSFLHQFNGVFTLKTEGVTAGKVKLGVFTLVHTLTNGIARFQIAALPLYNGNATLDATLDARASEPVFVQRFTLKDVDAEPLLKDVAEFDRIAGKTSGTVELRTKGLSEAALVSQLNGGGNLAFTDGKIRGVSLTALVDQIKSIKSALKSNASAPADSEAVSREASTEFSSLTGTFTIADGVASNQDLSMLAPLLKATGSGTVNLPKRTVNYLLKPSVVANMEGQTRATTDNSAALTVPIKVTGTFDKLSYRPDASSLIGDIAKDPKAAIKGIEENVKGLGGGFKSLLKGL